MNVKAVDGAYEVLLGADGAGGIVSTMTNHDLQLRSGGNATHAIVKANGNTWFGGLVGVGYQPEDLPSGLAGGVRCWDVVYSGGSYKASTIRSKENIRPLADVLERIECLNPVTFERSGDGAQPRPQLGFIAEEMREVFPECVVETDGDERDFFAWGLNQDALQGISIAGLQELLRRVKRLEAQLAKPPEDSRALPPAAPIEVLKEGSHVHGDGTRHAYVTVKFRATHPVFGSLATVRTLRLSAQPRAALLQREYERWVNSFDAVGHA